MEVPGKTGSLVETQPSRHTPRSQAMPTQNIAEALWRPAGRQRASTFTQIVAHIHPDCRRAERSGCLRGRGRVAWERGFLEPCDHAALPCCSVNFRGVSTLAGCIRSGGGGSGPIDAILARVGTWPATHLPVKQIGLQAAIFGGPMPIPALPHAGHGRLPPQQRSMGTTCLGSILPFSPRERLSADLLRRLSLTNPPSTGRCRLGSEATPSGRRYLFTLPFGRIAATGVGQNRKRLRFPFLRLSTGQDYPPPKIQILITSDSGAKYPIRINALWRRFLPNGRLSPTKRTAFSYQTDGCFFQLSTALP
jgi:hypothetical protein